MGTLLMMIGIITGFFIGFKAGGNRATKRVNLILNEYIDGLTIDDIENEQSNTDDS